MDSGDDTSGVSDVPDTASKGAGTKSKASRLRSLGAKGHAVVAKIKTHATDAVNVVPNTIAHPKRKLAALKENVAKVAQSMEKVIKTRMNQRKTKRAFIITTTQKAVTELQSQVSAHQSIADSLGASDSKRGKLASRFQTDAQHRMNALTARFKGLRAACTTRLVSLRQFEAYSSFMHAFELDTDALES